MFPDVTVVEQVTEKTHNAFPRCCKNSYARSHNSDNALENDASGAWIQIGCGVRHACNGEIAQQKISKAYLVLRFIARRTIGGATHHVNEGFHHVR
jgi:hypothetical protein